MSLAALQTLPPGVTEAAALLDGLDLCLAVGFSRLSDQERGRLAAFADLFAGSPLGESVAGAVSRLAESQFGPGNFAPLAVARASLLGAQHDALRAQLAECFQLADGSSADRPQLQVKDKEAVAQLSAAQHLLAELAISGFANTQPDQLAAFGPNLEALQEHAASARIAVLLTSFLTELQEALPVANPQEAPRKRWADLWMRSFLSAAYPVEPDLSQPRQISGVFTPVGADVRNSGFFVAAAIHGVLQPADGGEPFWTWVRCQSYKPDVIDGHETWALFRPQADPLLQALAESSSVRIEGGALHADGSLSAADIQPDAAPLDAAVELSDRAARLHPASDAYTRHPLHLAHPVSLRAVKLTEADDRWTAEVPEGVRFPLLTEAIPAWSELSEAKLESASQLLGLLRFDDGRWQIQPLCVHAQLPPVPQKKKAKPPKGAPREGWVRTGMHALAALEARPPETLEILSERASKLLRGGKS